MSTLPSSAATVTFAIEHSKISYETKKFGVGGIRTLHRRYGVSQIVVPYTPETARVNPMRRMLRRLIVTAPTPVLCIWTLLWFLRTRDVVCTILMPYRLQLWFAGHVHPAEVAFRRCSTEPDAAALDEFD